MGALLWIGMLRGDLLIVCRYSFKKIYTYNICTSCLIDNAYVCSVIYIVHIHDIIHNIIYIHVYIYIIYNIQSI